MAKGSIAPVAILCSSGTAALNFAAAVAEAFHGHVALLVLTADRPPELRDLGANQTIDQVRLYGPAVKWFVEMPLPEASAEAIRYVRMVAARAVATSGDDTPGPVHLNFPFREPLLTALREAGSETPTPLVRGRMQRRLGLGSDDLVERLSRAERGVIVCGPETYLNEKKLFELAQRLGFPVLADPLSNLRCRPSLNENVLGAYDSFLRLPALVESLAPDFVLRFGAPPTSKPLATYLKRYEDVHQVLVAPPGTWLDPEITASEVIDAELDVHDLLAKVDPAPRATGWLAAWQEAEQRALDATRAVIEADEAMSEPAVFHELPAALISGWTIFAGNSMPVRDLDSFFPAGKEHFSFAANRGVSGIDGVVSTALGVAAKQGGWLLLVVGDLSFYHDMNGLLAARSFGLRATIVLVNNDGGGIFSFLPQNDDEEHFEALFGTPHGLDFAPVATLYGLGWQRVETRAAYAAALREAAVAPGVNVIEVRTDRAANLALHQRIWRAVADAVAPLATK